MASGNADAALTGARIIFTEVSHSHAVPAGEAPSSITFPLAVVKGTRQEKGAGITCPTCARRLRRRWCSSDGTVSPCCCPLRHDAERWQITLFTPPAWPPRYGLLILPGPSLAWVLAKFDWRGKSLVETLIALPLVMPPVATGLLLLELCGRQGWIGGPLFRWFDLDLAFTWRAVLIATSAMAFPLLVRAARTGFESVAPEHEDAARVEGASRIQILWYVVLPLRDRRRPDRSYARARRVRRNHHGGRQYPRPDHHAFPGHLPARAVSDDPALGCWAYRPGLFGCTAPASSR